jgi:ABC-type antimicrobial peptide transport system permease subunit
LAAGPQAAVYVAYPQVPHGRGFLVVRSAGDKAAITRALRERLAGDVLLRTAEVKDLGRMAEAEVSRMGFVVALISGAAGLAFLLAGLGLFAVLSHVVQRAVPEIGVRIAVGATRAQAAGLVVLAVIKVAAVGAGFGAALAFLLVRYVGGLLGGTVPIDWGAIGMAAMLAVCGAVAAGAWPAFRATRVDPVIAIRVE